MISLGKLGDGHPEIPGNAQGFGRKARAAADAFGLMFQGITALPAAPPKPVASGDAPAGTGNGGSQHAKADAATRGGRSGDGSDIGDAPQPSDPGPLALSAAIAPLVAQWVAPPAIPAAAGAPEGGALGQAGAGPAALAKVAPASALQSAPATGNGAPPSPPTDIAQTPRRGGEKGDAADATATSPVDARSGITGPRASTTALAPTSASVDGALASNAMPVLASGAGGATIVEYRTHFGPMGRSSGSGQGPDRNERSSPPQARSESTRAPRTEAPSSPVGGDSGGDGAPAGGLIADGSATAQSAVNPQGLPQQALATLASVAADTADAIAAAAPQSAAGTIASPARHVTVAVDLNDLGVVNMSVTLSGNALTLRMSAEHGETARRLERDRESLTLLLGQAGFDAQVLGVDTISPQTADAGSTGGLAQSGPDQTSGGAGHGRANPDQGSQPSRPQDAGGGNETGTSANSGTGALYV